MNAYLSATTPVTLRALPTAEPERDETTLVASVAHELRNPLTAMHGYLSLLLEGEVGELTPRQKQCLEIVAANVQRMSHLTQDLLDTARADAGDVPLQCERIAVGAVIEQAVESLAPHLQSKGQTVHLDISGDLDPAWADSNRLTQILANLVSNAHKYTPRGGNIWISAEAEGTGSAHMLRITVRDDGMGIGPDEQSQLFTRFYRGSAEGRAPGNGLGLYLTRSLVERHGGTIAVASVPDHGTAVTFTLYASTPSSVTVTFTAINQRGNDPFSHGIYLFPGTPLGPGPAGDSRADPESVNPRYLAGAEVQPANARQNPNVLTIRAAGLAPGTYTVYIRNERSPLDPGSELQVDSATPCTPPPATPTPAPLPTATSTPTPPPAADLSVRITPDASIAVPGFPFGITVTVSNSGPTRAVAAAVSIDVSSDLTAPRWTCSASSGSSCGAASGTGGTISTSATLSPGATATFRITGGVRQTSLGAIDTSASVGAAPGLPDPNMANNAATSSVAVTSVADLSLTGAESPDPVTAGSALTYTFTAMNRGPSPATNVILAGTLPATVAVVSDSASQGNCAITGTRPNRLRCNLGQLASGASATVTIVVRPLPGTSPIVFTANVSSGATDSDTSNNDVSISTQVR